MHPFGRMMPAGSMIELYRKWPQRVACRAAALATYGPLAVRQLPAQMLLLMRARRCDGFPLSLRLSARAFWMPGAAQPVMTPNRTSGSNEAIASVQEALW